MTLDIMLPYYGDPELLRIAVRSVLSQDDPDWRLVVVDDGYPDDSVPGWFAAIDDDRVQYLRNERNLGANGNFRRCIELTENAYAVIMGSDDVMLPNYVSTVKRAYRTHPDAGIIQPGVLPIDELGRTYRTLVDEAKHRLYAPRVRVPREFGGEQLARSLLRGNWLYFPSLTWRSAGLRRYGFREGLNVVQDLALAMDLLLGGETLVVDGTVCFQYRRHRASDSSARALTGDRFVEERHYFLDIADELEAFGWRRAARSARNHLSSRLHALTYVPQAVRHGNRHGVNTLVQHALVPTARR